MDQLLKAIQEGTEHWWLHVLAGIYVLRQALRWIREATEEDGEQLFNRYSRYLMYVVHKWRMWRECYGVNNCP